MLKSCSNSSAGSWNAGVEVLLIGGAVMLELGLKDSIEDIFIMKMIANRPGDAPDCSALVIAELDFDVIYQEIEAQFRKAGEREQKIWITYIEEGIARLEDNDLIISIGDKISLLAHEYHEKAA